MFGIKILFSAAVLAGQQEALYSSVPDYFTRGMQRRRTANTPVKSNFRFSRPLPRLYVISFLFAIYSVK